MIFKCFNILLFCFLMFHGSIFGQSIDEIRKQKEKSEKEISYLNKLLDQAVQNKLSSTQKLNILQEKILQSKKLLNSLDQEVKYLQNSISFNEGRINELEKDRSSMLNLYAKLVYGSWKKRDKMNKMMFIFSSSDFNQAYNRFKYFQQIQEYSGRQLTLIKQVNDSLDDRNKELKSLIAQKNLVLNTINDKNRELESEKLKENGFIIELRKKEKELKRKLQVEKQKRQRLTQELNRLIAKQIKKSDKTSASKYKLTPEEKLVSDDFAKNKGKLPWPVAQGFISRKFGLSIDPMHTRVQDFNDGIDIMTSREADVRAVFKGVVIALTPCYNSIIIQHGNYFTVYSNLASFNVKKGDKVDTKDIIGKVGYDPDNSNILLFQLWKDNVRQNPELWLAK